MKPRLFDYADPSQRWKFSRTLKRLFLWVAIVAAVVVLSIGIPTAIWYTRFSHNMLLAERESEKINALLLHNPRFRNVSSCEQTRIEGILILGAINSAADLDALKQLVASTNPSRPIDWEVFIDAPPSNMLPADEVNH